AFTQPALYQKIRAHKTPREVYGARLVSEGVVSSADVEAMQQEITANFERIQASERDVPSNGKAGGKTSGAPAAAETAVPGDKLTALNEQLLHWPDTFKVNSRLARTLTRRRDALGDAGGIDWGHAEALAFSSLLTEGKSIRLTG